VSNSQLDFFHKADKHPGRKKLYMLANSSFDFEICIYHSCHHLSKRLAFILRCQWSSFA
jgi:hypothetical protein